MPIIHTVHWFVSCYTASVKCIAVGGLMYKDKMSNTDCRNSFAEARLSLLNTMLFSVFYFFKKDINFICSYY